MRERERKKRRNRNEKVAKIKAFKSEVLTLAHDTPKLENRMQPRSPYCDEIVLILAQCVEDPNYLYRPSIELWLRFFCPKYLLLPLEFTVFSIRRLVNGDGTSRRIRCAAPVLSKGMHVNQLEFSNTAR